MTGRTAYGLVLASLGLLTLAGCGEDPGYDSSAVESYLAQSQQEVLGGDVRASCPDDLETEEGMTFRCTLKVSGAALPYRVTLTHLDAERVTVSAAPDGVLISGVKVRDFVRTTLPKSSAAADVDCGGPFVVADVGEALDCTLALGAQERPITLTVKDESGVVAVGS